MEIRTIAYNLIRDWDEQAVYPNLALKSVLRNVDSVRDKKFISAIVYGVIERTITLDYFIGKCSDRSIDKISPPIKNALRMAIYQMFYMNIPESAACNTMVEIVKRSGFSRSCGFVNAILRRCAREKETLLLLKKADYSVRFSIAPEIVELLLEQYGKETFLKIVDGISSIDHSIHLFHNFKVVSETQFLSAMHDEGIALKPTEISHLFKAESGFSIEKSSAFNNGWYHVIGVNSARAASLVPKNAKKVLDLCAAPGGKTFAMAALIDGRIQAFDIHNHKIALMKENAARLNCQNVECTLGDATKFNEELINCADFILCDVPCSGLGIMGSKPDIKYKKYDSFAIVNVQAKILENAAHYLKSGGRIVYSTCTLDRRENDKQIMRFLDIHPDFSLDKEAVDDGMQTFFPQNDEDGFFIAVLRKD